MPGQGQGHGSAKRLPGASGKSFPEGGKICVITVVIHAASRLPCLPWRGCWLPRDAFSVKPPGSGVASLRLEGVRPCERAPLCWSSVTSENMCYSV